MQKNKKHISPVYYLLRGLARTCFKLFRKTSIEGLENIPPYGPLIAVSNHVSYNDPPYIAAIFPRPVFFLGKKELFKNKILGSIMRNVNVISLDRSGVGLSGLKSAMELLNEDQVVVIFPEGTTSDTGGLIKGRSGVSYLAIKSECPILPISITGTNHFPAWRLWMPLKKVHVNIGAAFTPPIVHGNISNDVLNSITDTIMVRIAYLLPPELRGVYGN